MRFSTATRVLIVGMVISGATVPLAKAAANPQKRPAQSGSAEAKGGGPPIEYRNPQYGFCFSLPESWRGYSIVVSHWQGYPINASASEKTQQGPIISIRDPRWTSAAPRQDIPIMIFTTGQWRAVQHEELNVTAAPFGPGELGRNQKYVFALPPRYNYGFLPGYEEVVQILNNRPLRGDCQTHGNKKKE